jgi:hypothetical protein
MLSLKLMNAITIGWLSPTIYYQFVEKGRRWNEPNKPNAFLTALVPYALPVAGAAFGCASAYLGNSAAPHYAVMLGKYLPGARVATFVAICAAGIAFPSYTTRGGYP